MTGNILFSIAVLCLLVLSFVLQEFMPVIDWAYGARFILPATVFLGASVTVSFPFMLALAFFSGLIWDARHLSFVAKGSELAGSAAGELALGYSILLFALVGAAMQGIRPFFERGRLEFPVIMTGLMTGAWLLMEYLFLIFRLGQPEFPERLWLKIGSTSLLALLLAPIVLFLLYRIARVTDYDVHYEGLSQNNYGR
jgi:hypothetical protein